MGRRVKKTITSKMGMIGGCLWAEDKKPVEKGAGYVWKTNWKTEQGKSSLFLFLNLVVPPHFCLQSYFLYLYTLSMLSAILTVLIPILLTNSTSPALAQNSGASVQHFGLLDTAVLPALKFNLQVHFPCASKSASFPWLLSFLLWNIHFPGASERNSDITFGSSLFFISHIQLWTRSC